MEKARTLVRMTLTVGVLTLIAMGFCLPALSDIAHGETDLDIEWAVLRLFALLVLMYLSLSFATIRMLLRQSKQSSA